MTSLDAAVTQLVHVRLQAALVRMAAAVRSLGWWTSDVSSGQPAHGVHGGYVDLGIAVIEGVKPFP